ncbi:hypothetical protein MCAG_05205 [Micromonospora sp. ATCC 39149]|uniref:hypothetical protein n=1 Tax=Micromonospora sp. (strain ATCC 39149 / NRRL 15099 / SCC 1413) TaxID=219305 RepID=UPI0001A4FEFE|nr:hypothetical protein [Micromonospora sp. ATCC 39149]EEP74878.1 hypothetical protein MCAG_05205 [Micromonospora sp. ATCC 39149]
MTITVLLCAVAAMARLPWLRRLAGPVIAVGTMSLTVYVGHILVIPALPGESATPPDANSTALLSAFILGAVVVAALWSRFFPRPRRPASPALRNLLNRLLGCLHHCLTTGQSYDPEKAFPGSNCPVTAPAAA